MRKLKTTRSGFAAGRGKPALVIAALGGVAASGIGLSFALSACGGVQFRSVAQIVVSDSSSTLADQSFSESAYDGLKAFYEANGVTNVPDASDPKVVENNGLWKKPGQTDDDRVRAYENVKNDGSNIVIATGFNQSAALHRVTSVSRFPADKASLKDTGFVFVDGTMSTDFVLTDAAGKRIDEWKTDPANVASVSYRADDGSFLAGIAAAAYLNENWEAFYGSRPESIGASGYVGLALPSTVSYLNGFRLGLMYWNKVCPLLALADGKSAIPIRWVSPAGKYDMSAFATGSFSANEPRAQTLTQNLIARGAKAILPVAGPQTPLSVNVVSAQSQNVAILGVDTAQEDIATLQKPMPRPRGDAQNVIPFSSTKNLAGSVKGVLEAIKSGVNRGLSPDDPGYAGFGYDNVADLTNDGVGVSPAGAKYLIDPLFFADQRPTVGGSAKPVAGVKVQKEGKEYTQYDLSGLLKDPVPAWSLADVKRASDPGAKPTIAANFARLLTHGALVNYQQPARTKAVHESGLPEAIQTAIDWTISGDELSKGDLAPGGSGANALLPAISGAGATYSLAEAFGAAGKTAKVAVSQPLDGTKWSYALTY